MVLFPRKSSKPKQGDSSKEELSSVSQHTGPLLPIRQEKPGLEKATLTEELKVCHIILSQEHLVTKH